MPEWRNGRRTRLKIEYSQGCGGSSPLSGTKFYRIKFQEKRNCFYQKQEQDSKSFCDRFRIL